MLVGKTVGILAQSKAVHQTSSILRRHMLTALAEAVQITNYY